MTFEIFVFRAQGFALKCQQKPLKGQWAPFVIAFGALVTNFLMGLSFARTLQTGEKQWRMQQQKNAKSATKK